MTDTSCVVAGMAAFRPAFSFLYSLDCMRPVISTYAPTFSFAAASATFRQHTQRDIICAVVAVYRHNKACDCYFSEACRCYPWILANMPAQLDFVLWISWWIIYCDHLCIDADFHPWFVRLWVVHVLCSYFAADQHFFSFFDVQKCFFVPAACPGN